MLAIPVIITMLAPILGSAIAFLLFSPAAPDLFAKVFAPAVLAAIVFLRVSGLLLILVGIGASALLRRRAQEFAVRAGS